MHKYTKGRCEMCFDGVSSYRIAITDFCANAEHANVRSIGFKVCIFSWIDLFVKNFGVFYERRDRHDPWNCDDRADDVLAIL